MKVFFLGTGSAEGFPALFCHCPLCRKAKERGGKNLRTRSSVLIDDIIKIDLPPDTLCHVLSYPQINLAALEHLLFTHSHDDHYAVCELQYLSPNFAPSRSEPLQVWATAALLEKISRDTSHFFEKAPLQMQPVQPFESVQVGHLQVTPVTAHHRPDELCLNFLLTETTGSGAKKTLLYASDTGWYDEPTWEFLSHQKIDTVIMECGKGKSNGAYDGHLSIEGVAAARKRLLKDGVIQEKTPFYLTHIAHTGLLLHEEMEACVHPLGMQVAHDGLEITL
ncbi:MAG: MBL fold metallo-hydrolase [Armatimonadaceae bacterium]